MSQTAEQTINYSTRFINAAFADMASFLKYLEEHSKSNKEYKVVKDLFESYLKHKGNAYIVPVKDIAVGDLSKEFKEMGIPNILASDAEKDLKFFIVRKQDVKAVNYAIEKVMARGRNISEVNFGVMAKESMYHNRALLMYSGLTDIQRKAMLEKAKNFGYTIATRLDPATQKYDIYFSEHDKENVQRAYLQTKSMEIGLTGQKYVSKMENSMKVIKDILQEASKPIDINEEKDFYVTSASNLYRNIHINKDGFQHNSESPNYRKIIRSYEGKGKNLEKQLYRELATFKNPVILTKEEWERTKGNEEERKKIVKEKQSVKYLYRSREAKEAADKEYAVRHLIESKLALDNGEQVENVSSFYNGEVGVQEFYEHEIVNQEHQEEENEIVLGYNELNEEMQKHVDQYAVDILNIYKENAEPERYYPTDADTRESLDELLDNARIEQAEYQINREMEEELFR